MQRLSNRRVSVKKRTSYLAHMKDISNACVVINEYVAGAQDQILTLCTVYVASYRQRSDTTAY